VASLLSKSPESQPKPPAFSLGGQSTPSILERLVRGSESPRLLPRSSELQNLYEEAAHIEELRTTYRKRLRILEKQVAHYGLYAAPAHILLDIENTEQAIGKLNPRLKDLEADIARYEAITMTIKIAFPGDFTRVRLTAEKKDSICLFIAQTLGYEPADILLEGIEAGSIVFKFKVPERAAARLVALKKANHALLSTIIKGVASLDIVVDESENDDVFQALVQREYQRLTEPADLTDEAAEVLHTDLKALLAADDAESTRAAIKHLYQRMVETGVIQDGATDTH
jgi:hypothetical protein